MLKQLVVQNIAIAENLTVEFDAGLNVITGETGAGKSILVDALTLLRGHKVDVSLIRTGSDVAVVAATFLLSHLGRVRILLEELGLPPHPDDANLLEIRRTLYRNQKHKAFVNDTPINAKTLALIADELIDISSQFENQQLLDARTHTRFLDLFCKNSQLSDEYSAAFLSFKEQLADLETIHKEEEFRKREASLYSFELKQIDDAGLSEKEFVDVQSVVMRGNKSVAVKKVLSELDQSISESDQSCVSQLKFVKRGLEKLHKLAAPAQELLKTSIGRVDEIQMLLEELSLDLEKDGRFFDIDEEVFENASERMGLYNKILQKFGPTLDKVHEHAEKCKTFLNQSIDLESRYKSLKKKTLVTIDACLLLAEKLSLKRTEGLNPLALAIQKELSALGMPRASFRSVLKNEQISDAMQLAFERHLALEFKSKNKEKLYALGDNGFEHAIFLLSANAGMEPQPIEKVASGGELSRVMLAIKNVLFENDTMSVFVFDEIDTGISGNIASKVGKKISEFCQRRQALCITHLPQVACYANNHFVVSKSVSANKTTTQIKLANAEERLHELASMISGEKVSKESMAQARNLVRDARAEVRL